ncbi:hypothetical protein NCGM1984_6305 [Pseudomonas aeruginosa]|nr:hypothetical protein NCGM1984_6305 [Pseudomonas aeruginosa]
MQHARHPGLSTGELSTGAGRLRLAIAPGRAPGTGRSRLGTGAEQSRADQPQGRATGTRPRLDEPGAGSRLQRQGHALQPGTDCPESRLSVPPGPRRALPALRRAGRMGKPADRTGEGRLPGELRPDAHRQSGETDGIWARGSRRVVRSAGGARRPLPTAQRRPGRRLQPAGMAGRHRPASGGEPWRGLPGLRRHGHRRRR